MVAQEEKSWTYGPFSEESKGEGSMLSIYKERWNKQVMWITDTRKIKPLFHQWTYSVFVHFELKDWKSTVLFRFKPFSDLSASTRRLNNFRLFSQWFKDKMLWVYTEFVLSVANRSKQTKFNLIFLWHGGWSLRLVIFCSKKTDPCCAL